MHRRFQGPVLRERIVRGLGGHCRGRKVVGELIGSWLFCGTDVGVRGGWRIGRGARVFLVVDDSICCVSSRSSGSLFYQQTRSDRRIPVYWVLTNRDNDCASFDTLS